MLNEIVFDENKNVEFDEREDNFLSNFEHFCHQAMNNDFNSANTNLQYVWNV